MGFFDDLLDTIVEPVVGPAQATTDALGTTSTGSKGSGTQVDPNYDEWVYRPGDELPLLSYDETNPAIFNQHMQAAARAYVDSPQYSGPPITWVRTDRGIYPAGGWQSIEPPSENYRYESNEVPLYDWLERLSGQDTAENPGSSTWMADYMQRSNNASIPPDQVPAPFSGNYAEVTEPFPGDYPEYPNLTQDGLPQYRDYQPGFDAGTPQQPAGPTGARQRENLVDFSQPGVNPFASTARQLGFTDYQDPLSATEPAPQGTQTPYVSSVDGQSGYADPLGTDTGYAGGGGLGVSPPVKRNSFGTPVKEYADPYQAPVNDIAAPSGFAGPADNPLPTALPAPQAPAPQTNFTPPPAPMGTLPVGDAVTQSLIAANTPKNPGQPAPTGKVGSLYADPYEGDIEAKAQDIGMLLNPNMLSQTGPGPAARGK